MYEHTHTCMSDCLINAHKVWRQESSAGTWLEWVEAGEDFWLEVKTWHIFIHANTEDYQKSCRTEPSNLTKFKVIELLQGRSGT